MVPNVSVIVPAFNAARTLPACLESLVAQRYPRSRYEILAVDNRSADRTADIIRSYGVTYLSETTRQSSYAARNRGLRRATGEIIAFTDADCVADSDWLMNGVSCFEDATVGGVAGKIGDASPVTVVQEYLHEALAQEGALSHPYLPYAQTANAFYRREVWQTVGAFEASWTSGGDADLAWRMQRSTAYRLTYCESALVWHQHRATRRAHFQQRRTWGRGEVCLYKRYRAGYRDRGVSYGPRECLRDYMQLMRMTGRALALWGRKVFKRGSAKEYEFALCDWLGELGNRIGRIEGSVKNRVWYP